MKKRIVKDYLNDIIESIRLSYDYDRKTLMCRLAFGLLFFNTARVLFHMLNMLIYISFYKSWITNPVCVAFNFVMMFIPFGLWVWSTTEEYFYYKNRKKNLLYYCVFNIFVILARYIVYYVEAVIAPVVFQVKPGEAITKGMLIWLVRGIVIIIIALFSFLFWKWILNSLLANEIFMKKILSFKIDHVVDFRKNKEFLYDQAILSDSETGKEIVYSFEDRFMHQFYQGSSGVGKTSAILKQIFTDMKQRTINLAYRETEYEKMLENGEAYIPFNKSGNIDEIIKPFPGYEKKLKEIREKAPNLGYTIIGPDGDLAVKSGNICDLFNVDYYLCDPERVNGEHKPHYKGINPYHIPSDVPSYELPVVIATISRRIADVLQAVFDESGATDPYFKGINTTCTTNISAILMAGMPYSDLGREPKLTDLSSMLMKFERIKPYLEIVKARYGDGDNNPFRHQIDFVETEMLGKKAMDLWSQARGLRDILDNLLDNPWICETLCADDPIDYKEVLDEGKVVLLNYGLKYGRSVAKGFALFYIMMFHEEVKNRDPNVFNVPHFEVIDELSIVINELWEEAITLLRKYRVAFTFAFQSNAQFLKNDYAKALDGIMRTVGQMIVFGRLDDTSSAIYNRLAGKAKTNIQQATISKNSIFSQDPSYSESVRNTPGREDYLDVSDLRNTEFLEVHVFPIKKGTALPPRKAKFAFVTDKEKFEAKKLNEDVRTREYWNQFKKQDGMILTNDSVEMFETTGFSFEEIDSNYEERYNTNIMGD